MSNAPNLIIPLAFSYNARDIAGYTGVLTNAIDQRKINVIYEPQINPITGKLTLYTAKRPGVADSGNTYGTSGQVAYLFEVGAGALTGSDRWVFSTSGSDVRASSSSTTTVVVTAAGYAPAFVDKTAISGTDTLILQIRNSTGTQRVFTSTAIGTFTEISDSDFTSLAHQGKIEPLDGYLFVATRNRIYNSDLNSTSAWGPSSYIERITTQDIGTGLAKLGNQLLFFGEATMEVYRNAGTPAHSPLEAVPHLAQDYGMASTIVTGMRHYSCVLDKRLFWVGSHPNGVFTYNGETVEKVSNPAIDKILAERQHYHIGTIGFQGQHAVAILLDTPDAATQRALLFFPMWKDWFEWTSTVFIPQATQRLHDLFLGVGSNQHKLYAVSETSNNYQDAGSNYTVTLQLKIPTEGMHNKKMPWCGVIGDTARTATSLAVSFSDDDYQTFSSARNIDMTSQKKMLYRCGQYRERAIRMTYTGSGGLRLESFIARIA